MGSQIVGNAECCHIDITIMVEKIICAPARLKANFTGSRSDGAALNFRVPFFRCIKHHKAAVASSH